MDGRAACKTVGSCSTIRLRSKCRLFFRRNWSHIREDGTDVAVLWFVKRGRLAVSHQAGECVAKAGDFVITRSTTPFAIECQTDADGLHERSEEHTSELQSRMRNSYADFWMRKKKQKKK